MHGIAAWGEDHRIQPLADLSEHPETAFAVILAGVFEDYGVYPAQITRALKTRTTFGNIPGVPGGTEREFHRIYCIHGNWTTPRFRIRSKAGSRL